MGPGPGAVLGQFTGNCALGKSLILRRHLADVSVFLTLVWLIVLKPRNRVTILLQSRDFESLQDCLSRLFVSNFESMYVILSWKFVILQNLHL